MLGEVPFYVRVADELEAQIAALDDGEPMPSEHELARNHDINRLTARAVLEELQRRYLVRRQQGRRTVVARRIDFRIDPKGVPGWSKTVAKAGATPRTEIVSIRTRPAPAEIRDALKLREKNAVHLLRRRYVDDDIAACSESWLNARYVPNLEKRLDKTGALSRALRVYGLEAKRGLLRCQLLVAPADVAARLESSERPLAFELMTHIMAGKRRLGMTTTWLRADVFNVIFELPERSKVH